VELIDELSEGFENGYKDIVIFLKDNIMVFLKNVNEPSLMPVIGIATDKMMEIIEMLY